MAAPVQSANGVLFFAAGTTTTGASSTTFTDSVTTPFASTFATADNSAVSVVGAGAAGADLVTTFTAFPSSSTATMATGASTAVTNANYIWGNWAAGAHPTITSTTVFKYTFAVSQTAGNTNYIVINWLPGSAVTSITDSNGNNYSQIITNNLAGNYAQFAWYAKGIKAGTNTITVTMNTAGANGNCSFSVFELQADSVSPLSQSTAPTGTTGNPSATITTKWAGETCIAVTGVGNHVTAGSTGFTTVVLADVLGDTSEYKTQAAPGSVTSNPTQSASGVWQIVLVSFRPALAIVVDDLVDLQAQTSKHRTPTRIELDGPEALQRLVVLSKLGWAPDDPEYAPRKRRPSALEGDFLKATTATAALLAIGWAGEEPARGRRLPAPVESQGAGGSVSLTDASIFDESLVPRGKGRLALPEDLIVQRQTVQLADIGWAPIDVDPRGKGRAPWPEEPLLKATKPLLTLGWIPTENEARGKGRLPVPEDQTLTSTKPLFTLGWLSVDVEPRGRGRAPWPEEPTLETRLAELGPMGWAPSDVDPRGKGRLPWPEDPTLETTKPLLSLGWITVDVDPRGKGRLAWPEDATLETRLAELGPMGWAPLDNEARGKGRAPWPEEPLLKATKPLLTTGWVEVEIAKRGAGRFSWPEDPILEQRTAAVVLPSAAAWAPDDPFPRRREQRPPDPDPLVKATKPLLSLGWITVDVDPRGKGRAPWPEDPAIVRSTTPVVLHSIGAWAPDDPLPRARERRFPDPDPNLTATKPLATTGWVDLEVVRRGYGRQPLPEDPTLEKTAVTLTSIAWADLEANRRAFGRAPLAEDPTLETAHVALAGMAWAVDEPARRIARAAAEDAFIGARTLSSLGWVEQEAWPRRRTPPVLPEDFVRIATPTLGSLAWVPSDVLLRGSGRTPLAEEPPTKATVVVHLPSIGWVQGYVEPRGAGRYPWPEDPSIIDTVKIIPIGKILGRTYALTGLLGSTNT